MKIFKILPLVSAITMAIPLLASFSCTTGSSNVFEQILSVIPDTADNRAYVVINDYAQIRREFEIDAPRIDATTEEQVEYYNSLISLNSPADIRLAAPFGFISGNAYIMHINNSLDSLRNLGLGYWSIDQEASVREPLNMLSIIRGQFAPDKTRQALDISSKDNPPSIETYMGNTIFGWGSDYNVLNMIKQFAPPAYDQLGRGGRYVFQNNFTFRTIKTTDMKFTLDVQKNEYDSLADVADFRLMARELSSHHALSALMSNETQSIDDFGRFYPQIDDGDWVEANIIDEYISQGTVLLPYETMSFGLARDNKGLYALIILVHADTKSAVKNVSRLRQRIEQTNSTWFGESFMSRYKVTDISIKNSGRVLVARLYGENIGKDWLNWYYISEPLLLHE